MPSSSAARLARPKSGCAPNASQQRLYRTVQDNGLGLSETSGNACFKPLGGCTSHIKGTGVGLYMIKRLMENAGATIFVTSAPTISSTFTVSFLSQANP
ncbi:hypothetical protein GO988_06285 [Hymenobacter sp. HMF4947]|uniref:histidine kinase n=1 Tax=Hymenobacter ginkgonis TaxID=2682976 RepID=A0A7K1TCM1_9BACT|nr:ATP-binding protein [Hymenobacter ginkgonis]MVN75931.1 hypothetical protein [Hymenobacter ginkgonis]